MDSTNFSQSPDEQQPSAPDARRTSRTNWGPAILAALAWAYSSLASLVACGTIHTLSKVPVGTGIRPLGWPVQIVLYGFGAPAFSTIMLILVLVSTRDLDASFRSKSLPRFLAAVACVLSVLPLLLTTLGMVWVIRARQLWLEP